MATKTSGGQVAIVTGGGTGIGKAAALALLADGWRVAVAGRRPEALEQVVAEAAAPGRTLAVPTDVTDPASVEALFAASGRSFGCWASSRLLAEPSGMTTLPGRSSWRVRSRAAGLVPRWQRSGRR